MRVDLFTDLHLALDALDVTDPKDVLGASSWVAHLPLQPFQQQHADAPPGLAEFLCAAEEAGALRRALSDRMLCHVCGDLAERHTTAGAVFKEVANPVFPHQHLREIKWFPDEVHRR